MKTIQNPSLIEIEFAKIISQSGGRNSEEISGQYHCG